MKLILSLFLIFVVAGIDAVYAEPLNNIDANIIESDGNSATILLSWDDDPDAIRYEAGCVSCDPNTSEFTTNNKITLSNITPLPNTDNVILYVIAYDSADEIINAKQVFLNINN